MIKTASMLLEIISHNIIKSEPQEAVRSGSRGNFKTEMSYFVNGKTYEIRVSNWGLDTKLGSN